MTKPKLQQLKVIVHEILKEDERSRNSDSLLYFKVLERIAKASECPESPLTMTVAYFLHHMNEHGFPPFESVRRARQKAQAECPELKPCEKVQALRFANEAEYKRFALTQSNGSISLPVINVETGEIYASAADAAEVLGVHRQMITNICCGHAKPRKGLRVEYLNGCYKGSSICWDCANAYGGCEWTGRDEFGKLKFEPVPGWEAVETSVSVGGGYRTDSYKVISCPKYVPEKKGGKHG